MTVMGWIWRACYLTRVSSSLIALAAITVSSRDDNTHREKCLCAAHGYQAEEVSVATLPQPQPS